MGSFIPWKLHGKRYGTAFAAAAALLICYAGVLRGMAQQWAGDEDMGHGFLVPVVIAFIVWRERKRWLALPVEPSAWGPVLVLAGACLQFFSIMGAGLFLGSVALVVSTIGAILWLGGFRWLRAWTLPLLLTLFMLPKLAVVYNQATLPLQLLASRMAAGILTLTGVGVIRAGNILDVGGHQVAVAEACSGIRYLLPLGFMAVVFAYVADSKPWMRVALLVAAAPIAIAANALRVAFSAYSPRLADGTMHQLLGLVIFVGCLATLLLVRRVCNTIVEAVHA